LQKVLVCIKWMNKKMEQLANKVHLGKWPLNGDGVTASQCQHLHLIQLFACCPLASQIK